MRDEGCWDFGDKVAVVLFVLATSCQPHAEWCAALQKVVSSPPATH